MKNILLLLGLIFTLKAMANIEFRPGTQEKSGEVRIKKARACFSELTISGCPHPREGHEIFISCLRQKQEELSSPCQKFFSKLYGRL